MKQTGKVLSIVALLLCLYDTAAAQRHIQFRERGFYSVVDLSYARNINRSIGLNGEADTMSVYAIGFSSGYQINKAAGLGAGFTYMHDPSGTYTQMPLFAELRSHLMSTRATPALILQVGYSIPLGASSPTAKIETGGIYFGAAVGTRYAVSRHCALGLNIGYKFINIRLLNRFDTQQQPTISDPIDLHIIHAGVSLHI